MRKLIILALLITSTMASAGRMKDIYIDTMDSIVSVLGTSEDYIRVKSQKFVSVQDADIAVATIIQDIYSGEYFECITKFDKRESGFQLRNTACR